MKIYKIIPVLFLLFVHNTGLLADDELFETPEGTPTDYLTKVTDGTTQNTPDKTKCTWDYGTNFTYTADNAQENDNIATKAYIYDYDNEWKEADKSDLFDKSGVDEISNKPYITLKPKELKSSSKVYVLFVSYVKDGDNLITNPGFENEEWSATNHGNMSQYDPVEPERYGLADGEGRYTIDNTLKGNNEESPTICSHDHSGSGKFFIANGSTDPTKKVWIQGFTPPQSISAGKYYAFSAWVMNWADDSYGNPPKLQFYITDGTTNGFETLGDITEVKTGNQCTWQQIFAIKKMSNRSITQLYLINSQTAGEGNDFALDDLYFGKVKKIYQLYTIDIGIYFEPEVISVALCPTLLTEDKTIGGVKKYIANKLSIDKDKLTIEGKEDGDDIVDNMEFEYKEDCDNDNTEPYISKIIKVTYTETPKKEWTRTTNQ